MGINEDFKTFCDALDAYKHKKDLKRALASVESVLEDVANGKLSEQDVRDNTRLAVGDEDIFNILDSTPNAGEIIVRLMEWRENAKVELETIGDCGESDPVGYMIKASGAEWYKD